MKLAITHRELYVLTKVLVQKSRKTNGYKCVDYGLFVLNDTGTPSTIA